MLIVVTAQPTVATLTDMMQPLTGPEESGPECRPGVLYYTALYCSTAVLLYYCTPPYSAKVKSPVHWGCRVQSEGNTV